MRYALMCEPQQGLSYDEVLALARAAEEVGFEAFFRSDHYASFPGDADLPTTDAWATLAGLARETRHIGLGTLVSPVTFRLPGAFAKLATTVDEMSGGRLEVGVGAGWNELEHAQLGLSFPPLGERYAMLAEELEILHRLWHDPPGWTLRGAHWRVEAGHLHAPPAADGRRPRIIVGGSGGRRMVDLVARWADEMNVNAASLEQLGSALARLDAACAAVGRDPATVTRSAMIPVLVGESRAAMVARTGELMTLFKTQSADAEGWLAQRRGRWITGTPNEARDKVAALEEAGVQRIMLQTFLPRDLDHVRLLASTLLG